MPAGARSAEAGAAAEEKRGRRRRRRGRGAERGDRASGGTSAETPGGADDDREDLDTPAETPAMERAAEAAPAPASAIEPVKAAKAAVEPAPERPSAGGSVSATASDAPPPRPRAVEAAPMAVADLLPMVESSGLKLAQTDPQKLAAAQARAAAMQPPSEHVGRERPVVPPIEEAPLTQVETRAQP